MFRAQGRALILGAVGTVLPMLAALAGVVPAQAGAAPGAQQIIINVATGQCLSIDMPPVSLAAFSCSDSFLGEGWSLVPVGQPGDDQLLNSGGQCLASDSLGRVSMVACSAGGTQWHVTPDPAAGSSAPNQIMAVASGACLSGAGGTVQLSACDGSTSEQWQRTQVTGFNTYSMLFAGSNDQSCLASNNGGSASPVYLTWPCINPNDVWHLVPVDHFGDWHIVNAQTGWCLDSDYNGSIATRTCNGGSFQTWEVTPSATNGTPPMVIKDVATGLCLGANSFGANTQSCNGSSAQNWEESGWPQASASFNLQNKNAPGKCIGTDANSGLAGLWPCTTHPDQVWHFETANAQGFAEVVDGYGNCLSIQSGSTALGAQLQASPCTGSQDQFWLRSGLFLQNFKSGFVAGVFGASTANGAPIVQWSRDTSNDQQWLES
jgi:hypothetical protein